MAEKMKVLHVTGALTGGGIQTFLLELLRHHDHERFSMDVCVMATYPGELAEEAMNTGASIYTCPLAASPFTFIPRFRKILLNGYEALHVHRSSMLQSAPLWIAKQQGIPVRVAHFQNVAQFPKGMSIRKTLNPLLRKVVLQSATHITGVSRPVLKTHFPKNFEADGRFQIIPNAINTSRYADRSQRDNYRNRWGLHGNDFVIGHSGRFSEAKNHGALLRIAAALKSENFPFQLILAGDGPLRPMIEELATKMNLQDRVRFAGWQADMPGFLSSLDAFVFPSKWEGLPLAMIEALAAGLPCITSDIECLREVLPEEFWSWRFPVANPLRAIPRLKIIAQDFEQRPKWSCTAREQAAKFDIKLIGREFEKIYLQAG